MRGVATDKPLPVTGKLIRASASFTRPANTTAYASGDLIANSTTAASVVPMAFAVGASAGLIRAGAFKSSNASMAASGSVRLHLWASLPTVSSGDNAAVFASTAGLSTSAGYLGYIDITPDAWFTDGTTGRGTPSPEIHFDLGPGNTTIYGLFEARAAITPASGSEITGVIAGVA